ERAEKAFARARRIPGVRALLLEGVGDARIDLRVLEDFDRPIALFAHERRDRHAPGALARDHPVRLALDHAVDAVFTLLRHPAGLADGGEGTVAQGVALFHLSPLG